MTRPVAKSRVVILDQQHRPFPLPLPMPPPDPKQGSGRVEREREGRESDASLSRDVVRESWPVI
jgi:hypothetical protein